MKCVRGAPNRGFRGPGGADRLYFHVSQGSVGQEMREGYAKLRPSWPWSLMIRGPGGANH